VTNKILFVLLLFYIVLFGQKKSSPVFIEHNSILNPSQIEYISYRIPYNQLLFVKNKDGYKASFTFAFEIYKDKTFIKREISKKEISTKIYDDTKSSKIYFEDVVNFNIKPNEYLLKPTLAIGSTELNIVLPELKLYVNNLLNENIFPPIIINDNKQIDQFTFELTNFQSYIPFSYKKYDLLIGIKDTSRTTIDIEIYQNKKSIYKKQISKMFNGNVKIEKTNHINLDTNKSCSPHGYFLVNNFSHLLEEGKFEIVVKVDTLEKRYPLEVFWQNKPQVLNDGEYSIKLLSYIEDTDIVQNLLRGDKEKYYKNLFEYWTEHYPTKIKYNYAINEYYLRADFAIKQFKSLKSKKGAESDRGRIYITYGEPSSIDRNYNESNEIIELWNYNKLKRTFAFKDITGTGRYILIEK